MSDQNSAWYVGRDSQRTGPFSFDQLRQQAATGQLLQSDLIWCEGMDQWMLASQHAELFARQHPIGTPPPLPPTAIPYARPVPEDPGQNAGLRMVIPVGRSGWAIAAGYFGLFSVIGCGGPFALICGFLALGEMKRNPKLHGAGRAWFGIIMGVVGTLLLILMGIGFAVRK